MVNSNIFIITILSLAFFNCETLLLMPLNRDVAKALHTCIGKDNTAVKQQFLRAVFSWYKRSNVPELNRCP